MNLRRLPKFVFSFFAFTLILAARGAEAPVKPIVDESLYAGMKWRLVGPPRGGRSPARRGVARGAHLFFFFAGTGGGARKHAFGPNPERGIFKTTDGGRTWRNVLFKDENTGGIDVVLDPHNPNIVYATLWQARRQPWYFSSGGPGSGLYRSIDGGETWQHLEGHGLPDGILGRIGVSVSGFDPNRIYALIEAQAGGLYRSDDGGDHWTRVNDDGRFRQRAWYFSKVYADPKSADTGYVLNTDL